MTATRRRHAAAAISWRAVVWGLVCMAFWDAAGLLFGGDRVWASPSYDALRQLAPWGMRTYGFALGALVVATAYAYGRDAEAPRPPWLLPLCLALLAGWYSGWLAGIVWSFVLHQQVLAWAAFGRLGFIAAIALLAARAAPRARG